MHPPLRLFIGNHAVEAIRDRLRSTIEEVRFLLLFILEYIGGLGCVLICCDGSRLRTGNTSIMPVETKTVVGTWVRAQSS